MNPLVALALGAQSDKLTRAFPELPAFETSDNDRLLPGCNGFGRCLTSQAPYLFPALGRSAALVGVVREFADKLFATGHASTWSLQRPFLPLFVPFAPALIAASLGIVGLLLVGSPANFAGAYSAISHRKFYLRTINSHLDSFQLDNHWPRTPIWYAIQNTGRQAKAIMTPRSVGSCRLASRGTVMGSPPLHDQSSG